MNQFCINSPLTNNFAQKSDKFLYFLKTFQTNCVYQRNECGKRVVGKFSRSYYTLLIDNWNVMPQFCIIYHNEQFWAEVWWNHSFWKKLQTNCAYQRNECGKRVVGKFSRSYYTLLLSLIVATSKARVWRSRHNLSCVHTHHSDFLILKTALNKRWFSTFWK